MNARAIIADDEFINKRISPGNDNIKPKGSSGFRATSFAIKPRPTEEYPSWSRQVLTTPEQLLKLEGDKGRDVSLWHVAAIKVNTVRALGLEVVASPTEEDPGHCYIVPTQEQPFVNKIWSTLAKETRIVYPVVED